MAVEITAAVDLSRRADDARAEPDERRARAVERQEGFLASFLGTSSRSSIGLRVSTRGEGTLRVHLVGTVEEPTAPAAWSAAERLRERLATVPEHLVAGPCDDPAAVIAPLDPPHRGIAQIHKNVRALLPQRQETGVHRFLGVEPFSRRPAPWAPLAEILLAQPAAVTLAVDLMAGTVPDRIRGTVAAEVNRFELLSQAGDEPLDVGGSRRLAADGGAVALLPVFQDAARRYGGQAFFFTVTVASSRVLDDALLQALARALCPPPREGPERSDAYDPSGVGAAGVVLRPRSAAEHERAVSGYRYGRPEPLPDPVLEAELADDRRRERPGRAELAELRVLVDPAEAATLVRLPVAADGQAPGVAVTAPRDAVRVVGRAAGPSLLLGRQPGGGPGADVHFPVADLPRHAFVVGTPGSGKTNTVLHLCEQLWTAHRVPFLVVEPVNTQLDDYRWLATRRGLDDLVVLTVGEEDVAPLRLNPFQVPDGLTVSAHVAGLVSCFEAAFGLWEPLPFIYRRALVATYRHAGFHGAVRGRAELRGRWPVLSDFVARLADVVSDLGYAGEFGANVDAASRLRAESLAEGTCASTLDCRESFDVGMLLRRPVVVELGAVGENPKEQALVTLVLLTALRGHYRANRHAADPPHVTILEEAHRIFPRATSAAAAGSGGSGDVAADPRALASERIAQGLAEDRKYRESYVLVDQQVGKISEDAYKVTNLKVLHRTASQEDRVLLGATMSLHVDQVDVAAALAPFEALVSHNGLDRAVTVTAPDVRGDDARERGLPEAPLADDDALARRHAALRAAEPAIERAMAPFAECAGCASRCRYRTEAEHIVALEGQTAPEVAPQHLDDLVTTLDAWCERFPPETPPAPSGHASDRPVCLFIHLARARHPPRLWDAETHRRSTSWARDVRAAWEARRE